MKSILITIIALIFSASFANAQVKQDTGKKMNSSGMHSQNKDYVTMKDGKLMENKGGTWTAVTSTFMCTDGSKVSTDGTVTMANGTTKKLGEGDKVSKEGKWWSKSDMKSKTDKNTPQ